MKNLEKNIFFYKVIFCHFFRGLHSKHRFSRASSPTFAGYNTHFRAIFIILAGCVKSTWDMQVWCLKGIVIIYMYIYIYICSCMYIIKY